MSDQPKIQHRYHTCLSHLGFYEMRCECGLTIKGTDGSWTEKVAAWKEHSEEATSE